MDAGNKDIGMAVVVVIPDGDSDVKPGAFHTSLFRDVGKDAVAVVPVEAIPVFGVGLFSGCEGRAVGEEDVGAAIPVVVEDSDTAGHGFRGVAGWTFVTVQSKRQSFELKENWRRGRLLAAREETTRTMPPMSNCAGRT